MKYKLETIPVWDAFDAEEECPFCLLQEQAQARYLEFFLGSSVMAPEMRVEVNQKGFCPEHYRELFFTKKNRHSLGLLSHTHLCEKDRELHKDLKGLSGWKGSRGLKKTLSSVSAKIDSELKECVICERIADTMSCYLYTAVELWKRDEEGFRKRFASSKGFCRHHLAGLIGMAAGQLSGKLLKEWIEVCFDLEERNARRLEDEILWYTQKFDFQNNDKPWGNSKDALERVISRLASRRTRDL